ncbi:MAG TPA: transglycosylase SLT domain-containing protein [Methylococcus sp.]|nr:transglycosylase SLT domain-containing protein [Methylococcus sp.]
MKIKKRLFVLFVLGGIPVVQPMADVYKFVDKSGHVYYTDRPGHKGYRLILRSEFRDRPARPMPVVRRIPQYSASVERNRQLLAPLIDEVADRYRLDPALLHAVIRAESAYNPDAISSKGAVGLMQLMPETAARYGVRDRQDPVENIEGGARYLSDLIGMFNDDVLLAVAAYNAGENNVIKYGNRVPPFPETRDYVSRVLDYYQRMN